MLYTQETYQFLALPLVLQTAILAAIATSLQAIDLTELLVNVYPIAG